MKTSIRRALPLVLLLVAGAFAAALAGGHLGRHHPALDSLSHFRAHLAVGLLLLAPLLLVVRERLAALAAACLSLASLSTVLGAYVPPGTATAAVASPDRPVYRLLHLNARYDNPTPERALSLIARERPDVITLNEASALWRDRLETIRAAYPHRVLCGRGKALGGVAILSRRAFAGDPAQACMDEGRFAAIEVDLGGSVVTVTALHLEWPWPFGQPAQVAALEPRLAAIDGPLLLAGDFNAVAWSAAVRRLSVAGDLEPVRGLGPTWLTHRLPAGLRRWIGLGIDHLLAGRGVAIVAARLGEDVGSDHAPLLAAFTVPALAPRLGEPTEALALLR